MPYLRIYTPELSVDLKRRIASELTEHIVSSLDLPEEYSHHTTIHFISFKPEDMAVAGKLVADGEQPHYQVEIYDRYLMPAKKETMAREVTALMGRLLELSKDQLPNIYVAFREYAGTELAIGGIFLNQT
jgi:phenylpyruvate tautomerase PptA (4-oxalocrotonate tautomerase family)